mgnify:CR=1 FL=1
MILKDYEKLPEKMKNEKVKEYYDIISKNKGGILYVNTT